ncbi:MAG TPA: NAD-dependent epimerase/dehydratase family protein [Oculatellaceae cyanobacterium]
MSKHLAQVTKVIKEDAATLASSLRAVLAPLSGASILITGAGGFICSFLVDVLAAANDSQLESPCKILALDNFQSGVPERVAHLQDHPHVEFINHDLRQPFRQQSKIDYIVHGASIASPPFYRRFPLETIDVNVNGTRHLLDLCSNGSRSMLYLSTSEVYGDPDPDFVPTPETYWGNVSCVGPRACYDESKRLAETLCTTYFRLHATPIKIVRPFNVYGPGQRIDDGRIVPDLLRAAIQRKPLVLFSNGKATRSFCYVKDAAKAILLVLMSGADGEAFNIGNDREEVTIRELAESLRRVLGPTSPPVECKVNDDPLYLTDNPQRRCPDLTKLRKETGFEPEISLESGLERALKSYRELAADHSFSET